MKRGVKFIFLLTGLLPWNFVQGQKINQQDSLALVALYNSTNGSSWTQSDNWLASGTHVVNWYGVTLDIAGPDLVVTEIRLPGNNLTGPLPDALFLVNYLKIVDFSNNAINGTLPPAFLNLGSLQKVNLSNNQITGTLGSGIAGMGSINNLDLSFNHLDGPLPDELYTLSDLVELRLNNNSFTGEISKSIKNLSLLQLLYLQHNHLDSRIPGELAQINSMTELDLSNNWFTHMDDLPGFYGLAELSVKVENNRLQFDDILNNFNGINIFSFSPQDSVNSHKTITLFEGDPFYIQTKVRGTANLYNWHKIDHSGVDYPDQGFNFDFNIPAVRGFEYQDLGTYYCVVTDDNGTGLTLTTRTTRLNILPCRSKNDVGDSLVLVALFNSTGGPN